MIQISVWPESCWVEGSGQQYPSPAEQVRVEPCQGNTGFIKTTNCPEQLRKTHQHSYHCFSRHPPAQASARPSLSIPSVAWVPAPSRYRPWQRAARQDCRYRSVLGLLELLAPVLQLGRQEEQQAERQEEQQAERQEEQQVERQAERQAQEAVSPRAVGYKCLQAPEVLDQAAGKDYLRSPSLMRLHTVP